MSSLVDGVEDDGRFSTKGCREILISAQVVETRTISLEEYSEELDPEPSMADRPQSLVAGAGLEGRARGLRAPRTIELAEYSEELDRKAGAALARRRPRKARARGLRRRRDPAKRRRAWGRRRCRASVVRGLGS